MKTKRWLTVISYYLSFKSSNCVLLKNYVIFNFFQGKNPPIVEKQVIFILPCKWGYIGKNTCRYRRFSSLSSVEKKNLPNTTRISITYPGNQCSLTSIVTKIWTWKAAKLGQTMGRCVFKLFGQVHWHKFRNNHCSK